MYNATGRGIPDISAQSLNFQVIVQSVPRLVSGTSAAAPTVAGIVSSHSLFVFPSTGGDTLIN